MNWSFSVLCWMCDGAGIFAFILISNPNPIYIYIAEKSSPLCRFTILTCRRLWCAFRSIFAGGENVNSYWNFVIKFWKCFLINSNFYQLQIEAKYPKRYPAKRPNISATKHKSENVSSISQFPIQLTNPSRKHSIQLLSKVCINISTIHNLFKWL